MATDESFVTHIVELLDNRLAVRYRKMFGEYALYCDDKVVGLICDNQLFVKQTEAGERLVENPELASPYEGAKPAFLISEFDDSEWLQNLLQSTADLLPKPKPKKRKKKPSSN